MKNKIVITILALVFTMSSCLKDSISGSGATKDETRTVAKFSNLELNMAATVNFVKDSNYFCIVSAQENILDVISTNVRSNTLKIGVETGVWLRRHSPITIEVHAPSLSDIDVSGSGSVNSDADIAATNMSFRISGSGKIDFNSIKTSSLKVEISGSGQVNLDEGNTDDLTIDISGSGKIEARDVVAKNCDIDISGSGTAYINVITKLYASISGSGNVYYKGNPNVETNVSGSGRIRKL